MYSYRLPPKSFVILYFPSENAPAPPNPLMTEQLSHPTQLLIFVPSIGHFLLLSSCPASNTATLRSGACFVSSYAENIPPGPAPIIITSYLIRAPSKIILYFFNLYPCSVSTHIFLHKNIVDHGNPCRSQLLSVAGRYAQPYYGLIHI